MLLGIDHLVIATPDLDEAVGRLRDRLGIEAGGGGDPPGARHGEPAGLVRRHATSSSSTSRIASLPRASWLGGPTVRLLDERGGGFVGFALASDDLERDVTAASGRSVPRSPSPSPVSGCGPMAPSSAGGSPCRASSARPRRRSSSSTIRTRRSGRRPTVRARATQVHPVGGSLRLTALEISMVDPARVAAAYRQMVGIGFEPWLGDGDWSLAANVGGQRIVLRPAEPLVRTVGRHPAGHDRRPVRRRRPVRLPVRHRAPAARPGRLRADDLRGGAPRRRAGSGRVVRSRRTPRSRGPCRRAGRGTRGWPAACRGPGRPCRGRGS